MKQNIFLFFNVVSVFVACKGTSTAPAAGPNSAPAVTDGRYAPAQLDAGVIAAKMAENQTHALSESQAKGKELYHNRCGNCHKLHDPNEYSEQDWNPILLRMQRKAKLTDEQLADVRVYIAHFTE